MSLYFAPMEGLTGYIYRNAYNKCFGDADKYFTPFVASMKLNHKEKNDVMPEHNQGMNTVVQILSNRAEEFICIAKQIEQYGYDVVNLNLGCPSGTVVSHGRGSGFLPLREELEKFLDAIFDRCPIKISIKTRIGKDSTDIWPGLIELYNQYPLEELIIHPRTQTQMYGGQVHLDCFMEAVKESRHKLCYNGDICTVEDYKRITEHFPEIENVMLGRGMLANPGLMREIKGGSKMSAKELKTFHDSIYHGYQEVLSGPAPTLAKMKELWVFMSTNFEDPHKVCKLIKKSTTFDKYESVLENIWDTFIY